MRYFTGIALGLCVFFGGIRGACCAKPAVVIQDGGHTLEIYCTVFSRDSRHLLTGGYDSTAILWETATGRRVQTFAGHRFSISAAAFSADGKTLMTAAAAAMEPGLDGNWLEVFVWDLATGKRRSSLTGVSKWRAGRVSFSADGRYFAHGSKSVLVWEVATGKFVRQITEVGKGAQVLDLALNGDGSRLLVTSETLHGEGDIRVWEPATGRKILSFSNKDVPHRVSRFSSDGRTVVSSGEQSAVWWNSTTGKRIGEIRDFPEGVRDISLSADGKRLASLHAWTDARLWDATTGRQLAKIENKLTNAFAIAIAPNGEHAVVGGFTGDLYGNEKPGAAVLWSVAKQRVESLLEGRQSVSINQVAVDAHAQQLVVASTSGPSKSLAAWDTVTGRRLANYGTDSDATPTFAFSRDGRLLITSRAGRVELWNAETGASVPAAATPPADPHNTYDQILGIRGGGTEVVTRNFDRLQIWDGQAGSRVRAFPLVWAIVRRGTGTEDQTAALSADGNRLLVCRVSDRAEADPRTDSVHGGTSTKAVHVLDTATGRTLQKIVPRQEPLSVAISPNGQLALVGCMYGEPAANAELWEVATARLVRSFAGHRGFVGTVAFSPDGKTALTGGDNLFALLWDVATGQRLQVLNHTSQIHLGGFLPDGRIVWTVTADGTLRFWEATTGRELASLLVLPGGQDWLVLTPDGLFDGSEGAREKVTLRMPDLSMVPIDRFFQDFYRPGLLAELLSGVRPVAEVALGSSQPPLIKIVRPLGGDADADEVLVEVEVTDRGGGISGPWLRHNGARVATAQQPRQNGNVRRLAFAVRLIEGENRIRVEAASGDGSWESEPAKLELVLTRSLSKPDLYAVVVGVNKYAEESLNLNFARPDASRLADLFERRGKSLYRDIHVTRLLDEQATRPAIRQALKQVSQQAQAQDTFLLFVSGHGTMVNQRYFFLPHEFRFDAGDDKASAARQGVAADDLGELLNAIPALKRMLVFDTCNSGAVIAKEGGLQRNPFAFRGAVERLGRSNGSFIIAAAAANQEATEFNQLGHGVLTYSLLAALRAVDAGPLAGKPVQSSGPDQVVGVLEWFSYADGNVPRVCKQLQGSQQQVKMSVQGSGFPVLPLSDD